jgi:membrane protein
MILFAVSVVAWLVAVALSVFGGPVRQWMIRGFGKSLVVRGFWNII